MNTSTVSKNVSVVRTGLDAFQRADIDTVKGAFTGDILFRQGPSGGTFERVYRGVGSVLAFFADIFTMTGGEFRFETIGLNDCGDDIVAHYCVVHAKRTDGRTVDAEQVQIYHMRHGLIAEIGVYSIDTETFEDSGRRAPYAEDLSLPPQSIRATSKYFCAMLTVWMVNPT